ncbi:hypothetical protein FA95DRAFT_1566998 [Auriscalpium vulgare]|uniref:Uncharacterized protein n=1 Tax=Auriscalpium vulgare TaxID=40419 RepID=A0ACB8R710_9AGAM|nr:hypothetical protein FA95DRAFT_1566998 [Auriscalpium vulgare]
MRLVFALHHRLPSLSLSLSSASSTLRLSTGSSAVVDIRQHSKLQVSQAAMPQDPSRVASVGARDAWCNGAPTRSAL